MTLKFYARVVLVSWCLIPTIAITKSEYVGWDIKVAFLCFQIGFEQDGDEIETY